MSSYDEPNVVESLLQKVSEYAETRAELLKLTTVERASELISSLAANAVVTLIAFVSLLLFSIAAALLLGQLLGRYSYGFLIVAIAFGVFGIITFLRREKWVKDPVSRLFIAKVLE